MTRRRRRGLYSTRYLNMIGLPAWSGKANYATKILGLSPIAYWPLNESSGTAAINYGSLGTGANGTYSGVTLANTTGPFGGVAPYLDGSDYINVYSAGLASAFNIDEGSMLIWCKIEAAQWTSGTGYVIYNYDVDNGTYARIAKSNTNNLIAMNYRAGGANHSITVSTGGNTNWFSLLLAWSQTADTVYFGYNGIWQAPVTPMAQWVGVLSNTRTLIGARLTTPTEPMIGWAAHAALWNRAITQTEYEAIGV